MTAGVATLAPQSAAWQARAKGLAPDRVTLIWLIAGLALVIVPHIVRLPAWYSVLFALAALERLSHEYIRRPPVPGWIRVVLTLVAVGAVALTYGTILGRQAGVALLCVMIAMKLIETYRRRDVYLLIALGYFVAITQFLFSQAIYLVVYIFASVFFITGTLIVSEVQPSRVRGRRAALGGILSILRNVGLILLQAVPLMVAMFVFFPRLSSPLWGMPEDALDAKTGISGEMAPGEVLGLFIDDTPAFRVAFEAAIPPPQERYWRGPVLWNFDGTTWTRPDFALRSPATIDESDIDEPYRYTVTMEPTERRWVFGLDIPVQRPRRGRIQLDHTMYRREPIIEIIAYEMASDPDYRIDEELSLLRRRAALELPQGFNPRSIELAEQWRSEYGADDNAIVQAALRMFNESFVYSYQPPPLGRNTVDDFLFETREGYCEYFSSSFTFLMRAAGIPARVVTGYQGGWFNAGAGYMLVRQSDAHAWSEVWLEGQGWVRVDPTAAVAPERVQDGALEALNVRRGVFDYAWLRQLRNRFDAVHNFWNEWVLKFDRERQRSLFKPAGVEDFKAQYGLIVLMILAALFVALVMRWLLKAQWIGGLDPAGREYARFCRKLARAGIGRQPSEGPKAFEARAVRGVPGLAESIRTITDLYIRLRYSRQPESNELLGELHQAVRTFPSRPRAAGPVT
ncbi:MAG: DUF3488 and transglutaminase-like domain-containing protein [Xanthomonadales bacterium]|nr:DUF3488 and transglutaminase-like domain-containing protein [Xanthomonadales bacterium]